MRRYRDRRGGAWFDGGEATASCLCAILMTLLVLATGLGLVQCLLHVSRHAVAFFVSAVLVLGAGAVCMRWKRARPRSATLVLALAAAGFLFGWPWFLSLGPGRDELESEGDALVACIESFRERVGRYPTTLDEAGCRARWNRFGGWDFTASDDNWRLSVGDYAADGFLLYRYRGMGWEWDT